jgi:A/G-specific adenine glycosylase
MTDFSDRILNWYNRHARVLPWRDNPDPYAIWVSEIMLQQTQVATVIPFFERWMVRFPKIRDLAGTDEQGVLNLWEGLGYYSRARNLHKAARIVVNELHEEIPRDPNDLRKLPGIGQYTAAAIASIAFGVDIATLDGNIKRVLSRVFDISIPVNSPKGEKILWGLVEEHLPAGRAGDYNQGLMDLGATICLPRNPICLVCPLGETCIARAAGNQNMRPVLKPKAAIPSRIKLAAVIYQDGKVLLVRRPSKGLLGGLWEFPASQVETDLPMGLSAAIEADYHLRVFPISFLAKISHAYTHFRLNEFAYLCKIESEIIDNSISWIHVSELQNFPMGKVDRQIANRLLNR